MTDPRAPGGTPSRRAGAQVVTAVVVTRGLTEYLPVTLAALAAQTSVPRTVLLVDADADAPSAGLSELVTRTWPPGSGPPDVRVVPAPHARTFGDAVRAALADADTAAGSGRAVSSGGSGWLWLLHDDSAPAPSALAELVHAVELAPSVGVAGCKQHTWTEPVRVVEVGVSTSRFGRRMTGIDEPEVDQGQHDGREDVLGVGIAGALVRRDVWDELGGTDPALGPYGDGLDLCRRARLAGHRVVVVPPAVVRHAQASLARPVVGAVVNRPGWDARRSAQARREAFLHSQLAGVPGLLIPVVAVLAVVSGVVRGLGRIATKEPHLVLAELVAPWSVLLRPRLVTDARRTARRTQRLSRTALRPLQLGWRDVVAAERDRRLTAAERRRARQAPSELELAELAALRSRRRGALTGVLLGAVTVTAAALGPAVARVIGGARLTGGSLPFADASLGELWDAVLADRVPGGLGGPGPTEPLLAVLLPLTALTGTLGRAAALVLLGALVLSAAGAWFAAGAATRSVGLRAWAALVWTAAPALLLALDGARLGAVLAHVALPWVALGVARAVGVARVEAVASGLVGARRIGRRRTAVPAEAVQPATRAEPSLTAAAGAGLAFALVTAGAPVLLPAGLLALAAVALAARRRRRLVWVALPALVLQGPTVVEAVETWRSGGWRLLLADPGLPLATDAAPTWQALLGWPAPPPAWADLPVPVPEILPLLATGVVVLVALAALVVGGRGGRAVRVGWTVATCGLLAAGAAARVAVGVADTSTSPGEAAQVLATAWPGSGTSLVLAGLLTAALAGAARRRPDQRSPGWRRPVAVTVAALAVLGPAATLGAWTWQARDAAGPALTTTDEPVVPAAGRQMQRSADAVRVLSLEVDATGQAQATLLRGDGLQLTDAARATAVQEVQGPPGEARATPFDAAEAELAEVTARLATGSSTGVAVDLAELGVGAVLVPPVSATRVTGRSPEALDEDGRLAVDGARAQLVGHIDSTLGLERMTETPAGVLWRVAGAEMGSTVAWARLVEADAGPVDGPVPSALPAGEGSVDALVPPGAGRRLVVLAERADPGWHAWLDGRPLRAVEMRWRQAFEVGPDGGRLVVRHDPAPRVPWLLVQGAVVLVVALLAVPVRRRRGGLR